MYGICISRSLSASENRPLILSSFLSDLHFFTFTTSFATSYAMLFVSLLAVAVTAVSASPVVAQAKTAALSLKHHSNISSVKNIVDKGQARINKINGATADVSSGSVTNEDVTYVAPVSIGGTTWQLIVDTGCTSLLGGALDTLY
jgi:3-polyprenyl-4-hydroxybenzoate decarboxylase